MSKNLDIAVFFGILTVSIAIEKVHKMTDISNTEYITINKDGIFVGGKPATTYRGKHIYCLNAVRDYFSGIQRLNKNVAELYVLSSATRGEYAVTGNPSCKSGPNVWCRVLLSDGRLGVWVFAYTSSSAANCAYNCARICADLVRHNADFRSAVFWATNEQGTKPVTQPEAELKQKLQDTDLSKLVGKPVQLNGYEIVVRKLAETQQIKR